MKIIARIFTPFKEKFGIPRQSGIANSIVSKIVFEPQYRRKEAFVGLSGYSHIWVIWKFSQTERDDFSPTVRPPRLGGNTRMGVFATRSPFRPNPIGLSSVRLVEIRDTERDGTVLIVSGADLMNGTPIYDIKPYLPFTDSHPDATGGFADEVKDYSLPVVFPEELIARVSEAKRDGLIKLLSNDPRPSYKAEGDRIYTFAYSDYEISFKVDEGTLTVTDVTDNKR